MDQKCLSDGAYVWPEGFAHYLEQHNVIPPQEFIDHVMEDPNATNLLRTQQLEDMFNDALNKFGNHPAASRIVVIDKLISVLMRDYAGISSHDSEEYHNVWSAANDFSKVLYSLKKKGTA